jgi:hypothetical protein
MGAFHGAESSDAPAAASESAAEWLLR